MTTNQLRSILWMLGALFSILEQMCITLNDGPDWLFLGMAAITGFCIGQSWVNFDKSKYERPIH